MRKLASVQEIVRIDSIENADKIELATVEGWRAVVRKGDFEVGQRVIFCEPDSILPKGNIFGDFAKDGTYRIKTAKLRGCVSQGIVFPLDILAGGNWDLPESLDAVPFPFTDLDIGTDVTEILGIEKYEKQIPVQLRGKVRGPISRLSVPRTDEERVQNIPDVLERNKCKVFLMREKIDGTSMSVYIDPETGMHVCSRNIDLAPDFEHAWNGDSYWRYATEHDLESVLRQLGGTIALQGELFGEGIQGNPYKLKGNFYRVFNMWDMANHRYVDSDVMQDTVEAFGLGKDFLVPELGEIVLNHSVDDLLKLATGKSVLSDTLREGIVFRPEHEDIDYKIGRLSFKAVSPEFLLKHGE